MLRRTGFKKTLRVRPPRPPLVLVPTGTLPNAVMWQNVGEVVAVPKAKPVRSEAYRRLVASLPCWRCGIAGYSQAAHSDSGADGKGLGLKACDLTCFPACGPRPGVEGCHYVIGTSAQLSREQRRRVERVAQADTKDALLHMAESDPKVRAVLVTVGLLP